MKKIVLTLMLLGLATGLFAGPVTPEKALQVAEKVFSTRSTKAAGGLHIIWDGETEATKADSQDPAFYVVGRDGGGFVIVAGNDNVRPVLALSFENNFAVEGMPENVRYWMDKIKRYARSATQATPEVEAQWDAFAQTKGYIYPEAGITNEFTDSRTYEWNQNAPANLKCPTVPGESEQAVCGCVPLAFSMIMTWFGYPEKGVGTVPSYVSYKGQANEYTVPEHDLGTVYRWEELQQLKTRELFYGSKSSDLGQNLGQLVYDVGTILQVGYSSKGTEGYTSRLEELVQYMGYSKRAVEKYYDSGYPAWTWDQMLKDEVTKHPVYYSGYSEKSDAHPDVSDGGHAYVLDGYAFHNTSELVFHFNFGWGGKCNGYYSSDYQYVVRTNDELCFDYVTAVFDFEPDPAGSSTFLRKLDYLYDGISAKDVNNQLKVYANYLHNAGSATFNGMLSLFRIDKNGTREAQPIHEHHINDLEPGSSYYGGDRGWSFTISYPANVCLGDRLAYYYKADEEEEYYLIGLVNPARGLEEYPLAPAAFIKTESAYSVGDYFYFLLINHGYSYKDAIWSITDPAGNTTIYNQDDGRMKLTTSGKYKIKVTPVEGEESIVAVINVK